MIKGEKKYVFNPRTLTYEPHHMSWARLLWVSVGWFSTAFIVAVLVVILGDRFYDSPEEMELKRENRQYALQYKLLNDQINRLDEVVRDLQHRDDNIYRVIFEAEPFPEELRKPGYGGVARYQNLEGFNNTKLIKATSTRLDRLSRKVYSLSKSYDEIAKLAANKHDLLASIPAIQPVSNQNLRRVASGFGFRIHPVYKTRVFHDGIDFTATRGTEVYATGDGVVEEVQYSGRGYGNYILVNHHFGYKTRYAHLQKANVKKGQHVKRGEVIGKVGSTGLSTGPHLHYEVIHNSKQVNPINFFHNDLSPEAYTRLLKIANQNNQSLD